MEINTVGIIGAGIMGAGIAQVCSEAGYKVLLNDISEEMLDMGIGRIASGLDKQIKRGKYTEEKKEKTLAGINKALKLKDLKPAQIVIEAATENEQIKLDLFRKLDEICDKDTILASNTSSISITKMGGVTKRMDKFIGMHFYNPVPVMKLVEVIKGLATSDETIKAVCDMAEKVGKTPVNVVDYPGFVGTRVLMVMVNEAIFTLMEGLGEPEAIDQAMVLGANQPMGPLALADLIGLDTCLSIMKVLQQGLGEDKYRPCPLLIKYVDAGYLGRKTGRGFYTY